MTPVVDVIIVSYNTAADTLACLAAVHTSRPASLGAVFLVDNGSTDGTVAAVGRDFPTVTLIALDRNVGFGAANNVALQRATAPLVLLLNPDTVPAAGSIQTLAERLEATAVVAAGPRLIGADGQPEVSFGRMLTPWTELVQLIRGRLARSPRQAARGYVNRLLAAEREVDWVSGACLLLRREAGAAVGFFDEQYFLYEEDVDLCAALRARGGRILFTPQASVMHHGGRSGAPRSAHYDRSHLAFYRKHAPHWAPWLAAWQRLRRRGT